MQLHRVCYLFEIPVEVGPSEGRGRERRSDGARIQELA